MRRRLAMPILAIGFLMVGCGDPEAEEASRSAEASRLAAALSPRDVVVEVDAVDREGTPALPNLPALGRITIGAGDGTEQGQYRLPLKNKGGTEGVTHRMHTGEVLSMNAQIVQGANGILCRISVDGEVVVENSSTGEYAVVSCVASVE